MSYQPDENSSFQQKYASAQWLAGLPALPLMVVSRKDIGYRLLAPAKLLVITTILVLVAILAMPDTDNPGPLALLIFAVLAFISGMSQRIERWRDLNRHIYGHSYYIGSSCVDFSWLPEFCRRNRRPARFIEPLFWAFLGFLLLPYLPLFALFLVFGAVCLRVYEDAVFMRERNRDMDINDSLVISLRHAEVVEQQKPIQPLKQLEPDVIASGLGPDIQEQVNRNKQNNTLKPNNEYEQAKTDTKPNHRGVCHRHHNGPNPTSHRCR